MYLTQHTDYGLRVLVYTAINDDTLVNIGTIAETYNISKSHLMKVVTSLVKGGFLVSVRGKGGGLRLADDPEKINIGAVVRHLEPMQVVECMGDNNECLITPSCRLPTYFIHRASQSTKYAERPTKSSGRLKTIQPY